MREYVRHDAPARRSIHLSPLKIVAKGKAAYHTTSTVAYSSARHSTTSGKETTKRYEVTPLSGSDPWSDASRRRLVVRPTDH